MEPLSIDEAFLDLGGTEKVHGGSPARTLARLILEIERKIGVSASVGLSHNKFLAKMASDLDKPRGFAVIGEEETLDFLAPRPVGSIYGVGRALETRLRRDGITTIGELRRVEEVGTAPPLRRHGTAAIQAVARHRRAQGGSQRDRPRASPAKRPS